MKIKIHEPGFFVVLSRTGAVVGKQKWRAGNMLYPLPVVLVTSRSREGRDNICTVAWTGTINSDPAMVSISLRKSRLSYGYIKETGVFVINLTTASLARAADFCGVKSGRDTDKFKVMKLEKEEADDISCPMLAASPVNIECRVVETHDLGSHTMFMAEVLSVYADEKYIDKNGKFDLNAAGPVVYSHGDYLETGRKIGSFGFSVRRKRQKQDSRV